jgi:uncharacterized protein (DUF1684 family)
MIPHPPAHRLATLVIALLVVAAAAAIASDPTANADLESYRKEIEDWRQTRVERLTGEEGWVTLVGLLWLDEGIQTLGSDPSNDLVFDTPKAPAVVGSLTVDGAKLHFEVAPGVVVTQDGEAVESLELRPDTAGEPTILDLGDLRFHVIERGGRYALRLRDRQHPARFDFPGIESYPTDPKWRIEGRFEVYDPPKKIPIPDVTGTVNEETSWGAVVFEASGQRLRLDALAEPGAETLFLIFGDQTSGRETYGGGRYLYAAAPDSDGRVVLDFNKAYNPPCAFTDFATCPLPPRQNRLATKVEAGEKKFDRPHP